MRRIFIIGSLCSAIILSSCKSDEASSPSERQLAKFEPADGKVILFVGQELEAIGGLDEFHDGYLDHFDKPAGWTAYTSLSPGDTSFGFVNKGLDGIWSTDNWGDHYSNMSLQLADESYSNMALAIGLSMVNHTDRVSKGLYDEYLQRLGSFLKSIRPRPVFLRIGYEFDGTWNRYDPTQYKEAFIHIRHVLSTMGCDNVAYVWQSTGWGSSEKDLEKWYPGNEYVDWCAFSFFNRWSEDQMIPFARRRGKPVFVAEASPTISDSTYKEDGDTRETILSNQQQADEAWDQWFMPLFHTFDDHADVVKAVSYINCNWRSHSMWRDNPTFRDVDARLQINPTIAKRWRDEVSKERYIHASTALYDDLVNHR